MRFIGKSLPEEAEMWFRRAAAQAPGRREPYVDLTKLYYEAQEWDKCLKAAEDALAIKEKPLEYLCEAESWGYAPWDYAAIAAFNLGQFDKALEYATKAVELEPTDERLQSNLKLCRNAVETVNQAKNETKKKKK